MLPDKLGTCPICGNNLSRAGQYLVCIAGDYKVLETTFDSIWNDFIAVREKGESDNLALTEKLVEDLRNANEKEA